MNAHIKSYAIFLAFTLVTAIVVRPIVKQMNIPILSDI